MASPKHSLICHWHSIPPSLPAHTSLIDLNVQLLQTTPKNPRTRVFKMRETIATIATTTSNSSSREINFIGNQRRRKGNLTHKERTMRPSHPMSRDKQQLDLFHKYLSRDKSKGVQWRDEVRPDRKRHQFNTETRMAVKVQVEVQGRKKRITTWQPLTRAKRVKKPMQGQDTRLCRDATNMKIKAVNQAIKSREKSRPQQQSKLQEYKCLGM